MLNLNQINALAKKNKTKKKTKTYSVGQDVIVNYDPFGKHSRRHATITRKEKNGYMVRFQSTKGSSCDGVNRKAYQRKDGTWVTLTMTEEFITKEQIIR